MDHTRVALFTKLGAIAETEENSQLCELNRFFFKKSDFFLLHTAYIVRVPGSRDGIRILNEKKGIRKHIQTKTCWGIAIASTDAVVVPAMKTHRHAVRRRSNGIVSQPGKRPHCSPWNFQEIGVGHGERLAIALACRKSNAVSYVCKCEPVCVCVYESVCLFNFQARILHIHDAKYI